MKYDPDKHKAFRTFEDACAAQNHSDLCKDTPTKIDLRRAKRQEGAKRFVGDLMDAGGDLRFTGAD